MPKLWEIEKFRFESTRFEPGFMMFASLTRSISPDFTLLQFSVAIVVNSVIFWFIKNNTPHKFLCLSFYFLALYLNLNTQVLREALAVSVFLLAWPYFRDGKWLQYYILALLASFMHTSALLTLFLPLSCVPGVREGFRFGWRTLFICVFLLVAGYLIQTRFTDFFMMLAVSDRLMDRVSVYSNDYAGGSVLNFFGAADLFIRSIMLPLVALYFTGNKMKKVTDKKILKNYNRLETMVLTCIYFSVLTIPIFIFSRYYNYFGIFALVIISSWAFSSLKFKKKTYKLNIGYWALILMIFYVFNFKAYFAPANKSGTLKTYMIYYPYATRLDPFMDSNREAIYRYNHVR